MNSEAKDPINLIEDMLYAGRSSSNTMALRAYIQAAEPKIRELHRENKSLQYLKTAGIVEIAATNSNVADYCKHWEGRAEKSEVKASELQRENAELNAINKLLFEESNSELKLKEFLNKENEKLKKELNCHFNREEILDMLADRNKELTAANERIQKLEAWKTVIVKELKLDDDPEFWEDLEMLENIAEEHCYCYEKREEIEVIEKQLACANERIKELERHSKHWEDRIDAGIHAKLQVCMELKKASERIKELEGHANEMDSDSQELLIRAEKAQAQCAEMWGTLLMTQKVLDDNKVNHPELAERIARQIAGNAGRE